MAQLSCPQGLFVDQFGDIIVADLENHRVMRWHEGAEEGTIVVGGKSPVEAPNQLNRPVSLLFDNKENLYVVDIGNNRIQKLDRNSH